MRGTVWRLVVLTALLAIYPAAMLAFHFLAPARADGGFEVRLEVRAEIIRVGPGVQLEAWLALDNRGLETLSLEQVLLDVSRGEEPEVALIVGRPALRSMTGSAGLLRPSERREVGPFHLELPLGATSRTLQVSATVRPVDGSRSREIHQRVEVPAGRATPPAPQG
ncbi:MAG: hypothetical protein Q9Q40_00195 [Acidobacteriota bacterium]|nr:hypothetical protein [Acidobacteriota bacterium]MDQ7087384.1 hypothetical protein [Acidobacteriota bacterium]